MSDRSDQNDRPADTIRDGALKATIWENHGENGAYFSTTFGKTYEDRDGKLRDSQSFSAGDLLRVSELARQAYVRSRSLQREMSQDHRAEHGRHEARDEDRSAYQSRRGANGERRRRSPQGDRDER